MNAVSSVNFCGLNKTEGVKGEKTNAYLLGQSIKDWFVRSSSSEEVDETKKTLKEYSKIVDKSTKYNKLAKGRDKQQFASMYAQGKIDLNTVKTFAPISSLSLDDMSRIYEESKTNDKLVDNVTRSIENINNEKWGMQVTGFNKKTPKDGEYHIETTDKDPSYTLLGNKRPRNDQMDRYYNANTGKCREIIYKTAMSKSKTDNWIHTENGIQEQDTHVYTQTDPETNKQQVIGYKSEVYTRVGLDCDPIENTKCEATDDKNVLKLKTYDGDDNKTPKEVKYAHVELTEAGELVITEVDKKE